MDTISEHIVYVVYVPFKGFLKGSSRVSYTPDFYKARVFVNKNHATNSNCGREKGAVVIDVKLTLDTQKILLSHLTA